jgi:ubiquinone/menaquinone biosynthesis C-methylase UbiE
MKKIFASDQNLKKVHDFWNSESCGERYASGDTYVKKFLSEKKNRYKLEPYIKKFANFAEFKDKDVLEIGVGFGCDHSEIASHKPKSLTGIDLTQRAIDNTKLRFNTLGLKSLLKTDNAERLSFKDESFDAVYSWGVLHHSPNTKKCFEEVYRVLRPGGFAKIMIYHKFSPVGWMLWIKYGLLKLKPFISQDRIYADYLESPGTKAYTKAEAYNLLEFFSYKEIYVQLSFADILQGDVGVRHKGLLLRLIKFIYPKKIIEIISNFFPIGLYLCIRLKK